MVRSDAMVHLVAMVCLDAMVHLDVMVHLDAMVRLDAMARLDALTSFPVSNASFCRLECPMFSSVFFNALFPRRNIYNLII